MNKEHRENLARALDDELKRIKTKEESIEILKMCGILAPNGDLSPLFYTYPEGCLQIWNPIKV